MANLIGASNNSDTLSLDNLETFKESICPELDHSHDLAFFIVRCFSLFFVLIGIIIILVNLCRGNR